MDAICANCRFYSPSNSSAGSGRCEFLQSIPGGWDLIELLERAEISPRYTRYDADTCLHFRSSDHAD